MLCTGVFSGIGVQDRHAVANDEMFRDVTEAAVFVAAGSEFVDRKTASYTRRHRTDQSWFMRKLTRAAADEKKVLQRGRHHAVPLGRDHDKGVAVG